jgi:hypothetical protein
VGIVGAMMFVGVPHATSAALGTVAATGTSPSKKVLEKPYFAFFIF